MNFTAVKHMFHVFLHNTTTAAVLAFRACARLAGTLVVLALGACIPLLLQPDLWCLVLHAHRLAALMQAWRDSGPHNSLLGRVRSRLAATGLLAVPRDPLAVCGMPDGEGWRHLLQLMVLPDGHQACLEREMQLAWEEHLAFTAALLLAAACLGMLVLCLLLWAWCRHQHPAGAGDDAPPDEGQEGENAATPGAAEVGEDTALPDTAEEGGDTASPDVTEEGEDAGPPGAAEEREAAPGNGAPPQTPADPGRGEGGREVRHSLHVPPCLRERLAGPQECFLEYLRRRHNILIFMDASRRRMHVKGVKEDVVLCCGAVRALLAQWRRHHAAAPE